jgi:formylglycine-generating enzyme required for sulfatase activity
MGERLVPSRLLRDAGRAGGVARNPRGPETSYDPAEPGQPKRVHRGGSFLCTEQYCTRYMLGTRGKGEVRTGSNHVGFRCVRSPAGPPA